MNNKNREEAKKWAALFQAVADGESLQRYNSKNARWEDLPSGERPNVVVYFPHEYRIKPKPAEFEVWYNPNPPCEWRRAVSAEIPGEVCWKGRGYNKIKMREVQD